MNGLAGLKLLSAIVVGGGAGGALPPFVFGDEGGWAIVSRGGDLIERISSPCGLRARELALTADLQTFIVSAWSAEKQNAFLFSCSREKGAPWSLGEQTGYHGHPAVSPDGQWVYFVHHPRKGGPPGQHEPGAFGQLYRVRLDGSELTALTATPGCKLAPRISGNVAAYIHATCHGPRSIELFDTRKREVVALLEPDQNVHYADLSGDQRTALVTKELWEETQVIAVDVRTKAERVLLSLPAGYEDTHTVWSTKQNTILYQRLGAVWRASPGKRPTEERLFDIGGPS